VYLLLNTAGNNIIRRKYNPALVSVPSRYFSGFATVRQITDRQRQRDRERRDRDTQTKGHGIESVMNNCSAIKTDEAQAARNTGIKPARYRLPEQLQLLAATTIYEQ